MTLNENTSKRWIDSVNEFVMDQVQLITEVKFENTFNQPFDLF